MGRELYYQSGVLVGLYALALAARLGAAAALGLSPELVGDEEEYYAPAVHLLAGDGYRTVGQQSADGVARPTAYRMPGTALTLAAGMSVLGEGVVRARILCMLASSLSAPLGYLLARRAGLSRAAFATGVVAAVYPVWAHLSLQIVSECYYIPLLLAALVLTLRALDGGSWSVLAAGLVWGVATLFRPHALVMSVPIACYLSWHRWRLSTGAVLLAGVGMILTPWVVRNAVVFGRLVPLATEGGETFLGANNPYALEPGAHGMWLAPTVIPEYRTRLAPVQDELARNELQYRIGLDYLYSHPGQVPVLVGYKLWRWLTPVTVTGGIVRVLVLGSYGGLLLLLLVGAARGRLAWAPAVHLASICTLVSAVITCVYWGNLTRGRLPLELVWLPWAATAGYDLIGPLFDRATGRRLREECAAAGVIPAPVVPLPTDGTDGVTVLTVPVKPVPARDAPRR